MAKRKAYQKHSIGDIVRCTLTRLHYQGDPREGEDLCLAGWLGETEVVVPVWEFIPLNHPFMEDSGPAFKKRLAGLLGISYDLKLTGIDMEGHFLASKIQADLIHQRSLFFGPHPVREGSRISVTVIEVEREYLRVEIYGVNTILKREDVSSARLSSLAESYRVGQQIDVLIVKLKVDESEYRVKNLVVSRKEALKEERLKLMESYQSGDYVFGKVIFLNETECDVGLKNGLAVTVMVSKALERLKLRDSVCVRIVKVDFQNGRILGQLINPPSHNQIAYY